MYITVLCITIIIQLRPWWPVKSSININLKFIPFFTSFDVATNCYKIKIYVLPHATVFHFHMTPVVYDWIQFLMINAKLYRLLKFMLHLKNKLKLFKKLCY